MRSPPIPFFCFLFRAQRASGTLAFLWHETNCFLCLYHCWPSTRRFSACECSPHPHWNLLWIAQVRTDSSFLVFGRWYVSSSLSCSNFLRFESLSPAHLWIYYSLISATLAFWWHETNFFLCLTTSALTHDVLQRVSFHPIPIAICCALPSVRQVRTNFLPVHVHGEWAMTSTFDRDST